MDWCNNYGQPINDLKTAPVVPGQEVVVTVTDMHESGAGVGHHADSGFVIMVDGVLPEAKVKAKVSKVKPNYARADLLEKLPEEPDEDEEDEQEGEEEEDEEAEEEQERRSPRKRNPRLGSRENFWGS